MSDKSNRRAANHFWKMVNYYRSDIYNVLNCSKYFDNKMICRNIICGQSFGRDSRTFSVNLNVIDGGCICMFRVESLNFIFLCSNEQNEAAIDVSGQWRMCVE